MSLEQIFYLTQSIAAIAVLASLVFLDFEIRQNSREITSRSDNDSANLERAFCRGRIPPASDRIRCTEEWQRSNS
jgi:hypothetical protein